MLPPKAKKRRTKYDPEEEKRLANIVFATGGDIVDNLLKIDNENEDIKKESNESESEEQVLAFDSDDNNEIESDDDDDHADADADEKNDEDSDNVDDEEENENSDNVNDEQENEDSEDKESEKDEKKFFIKEEKYTKKRKPAWVDEDDEKQSVDDALKIQGRKLPGDHSGKKYKDIVKEKFTKIYGTPKWATIKDDHEKDSDHQILKQSNHLAVSKSNKLKSGLIDLKVMRDINHETGDEGPIVTSLQFHPNSTVAYVAGLSRKLSVFKVDGKENTVLTSLNFDKFPIASARWLKEGNQIVLGCRYQRYIQTYDLISGSISQSLLPHKVTNMQRFEVSPNGKFIAIAGRLGDIYLLNALTKELICTFKMNKTCFALAFTPDSQFLFSHGDGDEIYVWDLKQRECINKSIDDGCQKSKAISISPNGQFFAAGSGHGIVNIYDIKSVMETSRPVPLKIIKNLVTPISCVKFNPTSEIMAIASKDIENGFKMVHIPSFKVFSNFPTFKTVMNKPMAIDFSPGSGFLGVTNNNNKAYLYKLKHFENY